MTQCVGGDRQPSPDTADVSPVTSVAVTQQEAIDMEPIDTAAHVMDMSPSVNVSYCHDQVQRSHAFSKDLDIFSKISRTWKLPENEFGPLKSWELNVERDIRDTSYSVSIV